MSGHTPGPWYVSLDPYPHIRGADDACLLARDWEPTEADAHLIAAASTLLEVAVALDAYWREDYPPPGEIGEKRKDDLHFTTLAIWRQIRAAIALATGAA